MNYTVVDHLIGPEPVEDFVHGISTRPRIFRGGGRDFEHLLTIEDIDHLLTITALRPPFVALVNGKTGLRSTDYNIYHEAAVQCSRPGSILVEHFRHGTTVIVQHIHLLHPGVGAFVEYLCRRLHPMSIQTNCYLTPANAQGIHPHVDQHHTLLLQLSGRKRWCVWENIDQDPQQPMINTGVDPKLPEIIADSTDPLLDDWVETGDFILIPRGFIHTPYTGSAHSLHLTLGIMDPSEQTTAELMYRQFTAEASSLAFASASLSEGACNPSALEARRFFPPVKFVEVI